MKSIDENIAFKGLVHMMNELDVFTCHERRKSVQIRKVLSSYSKRTKKHTTVVFFDDDTKIIVVRGHHEKNDTEKAVLWAYFIKNSGKTRTQAKKEMKMHLEESK